jgi:hypothetical protein
MINDFLTGILESTPLSSYPLSTSSTSILHPSKDTIRSPSARVTVCPVFRVLSFWLLLYLIYAKPFWRNTVHFVEAVQLHSMQYSVPIAAHHYVAIQPDYSSPEPPQDVQRMSARMSALSYWWCGDCRLLEKFDARSAIRCAAFLQMLYNVSYRFLCMCRLLVLTAVIHTPLSNDHGKQWTIGDSIFTMACWCSWDRVSSWFGAHK